MRRVVIALVFCAVSGGKTQEVAWKGLAADNGEPIFSLYSVPDQTSKWISLGQSFAGARAVRFDSDRETLTVDQETGRKELTMQTAPIRKLEIRAENKIRLDGSGAILSGTSTFSLEQIDALVATFDKSVPLRIESSGGVTFGFLTAVFNAIRATGIPRITISTATQ
jgi:biopolymer transport protein ExbD